MNKFEKLDKLDELGVGETITIDGTTPSEVREYVKKQNEENKGKTVPFKTIAVTNTIVTVVRTEGRKSRMRDELLGAINKMHPFQRLFMSNYKLSYVRKVLAEIQANDGRVFQCVDIPHIDGIRNEIEIFTDPFDFNNGQEFTMEEMMKSFIEEMSEFCSVNVADIKYQMNIICDSDEETDNEADSQEA